MNLELVALVVDLGVLALATTCGRGLMSGIRGIVALVSVRWIISLITSSGGSPERRITMGTDMVDLGGRKKVLTATGIRVEGVEMEVDLLMEGSERAGNWWIINKQLGSSGRQTPPHSSFSPREC